MKNQRSWVFLLFLLPAIALGDELRFRLYGDGFMSWFLTIKNEHYTICELNNKKTTLTEGVVIVENGVFLFRDSATSTKRSFVHDRRFVPRSDGEDMYLVDEDRIAEFHEALSEKVPFERRSRLAEYFLRDKSDGKGRPAGFPCTAQPEHVRS